MKDNFNRNFNLFFFFMTVIFFSFVFYLKSLGYVERPDGFIVVVGVAGLIAQYITLKHILMSGLSVSRKESLLSNRLMISKEKSGKIIKRFLSYENIIFDENFQAIKSNSNELPKFNEIDTSNKMATLLNIVKLERYHNSTNWKDEKVFSFIKENEWEYKLLKY